ncbi:hypothetical protein K7I13_11885 [Brucepastera parasyntrophica]|uniref:hypothetical protein n=1 Tax=Brucepastera parasyntrophica TaxID=2880008 RepID=UPI00210E580E|nr:hypothetical protein [Brucepastera parasyntrophica]ULQ59188.1 hypothetical protein K7I13_11885 [Brucepastera parasyntrophica]
MNKASKLPAVLLCLIPCFVLFAACATGKGAEESRTPAVLPTGTEWGYVELTASTLKLPNLTLASSTIRAKSTGADEKGIDLIWSGASLDDFNALAGECFTKIPANLNWFGKVSALESLKRDSSHFWEFEAYYKTSATAYQIFIRYFYDDYYELTGIVNGTLALHIIEYPDF